MKNIKLLLITTLLLIAIILTSCGESPQVVVQAEGDLILQELELSDFEKIEVKDMFKVEVVQGDNFQVMVEIEESLIPYLEVVSRWKTLKIGLKSGHDYHFQNAIPRVEVTLPTFTRVGVTGKSTVVIHDFTSLGDLKLEVGDFSSLSAAIEADSIQVDINGHSSVNISGIAQEVTGNIAGQSSLNLLKLTTQEVSVVSDQHSEVKE